MLTPQQLKEIDAAMIEPDDLMDLPTKSEWEAAGFTVPDELCSPQKPTELDQFATLSNAVLMLESTAREIEASPAGYSVETVAYGIRCRCESWRENINQRLRLLNR